MAGPFYLLRVFFFSSLKRGPVEKCLGAFQTWSLRSQGEIRIRSRKGCFPIMSKRHYICLGVDFFKMQSQGHPWWISGKESACQCRRHGFGFNPWSEKTPQASEKLSLCAYWSLPALKPMLCNKRSHHNEKPVHCNWRVALALCS